MQDAARRGAGAHVAQIQAQFPGAAAHRWGGDRTFGERCARRRRSRRTRGCGRRRRGCRRGRSGSCRRCSRGGRRRRRRRRCRCRCRCRCRRCCRGWCRCLPLRRRAGGEADQLATHAQHAADFAAQRQHAPGDRRRNLDRRLVGHDVGHRLVFCDLVSHRDMPGDEFGFDDAFAQIGHFDDVVGHDQFSITRCSALATRAGPGKYIHSCACG